METRLKQILIPDRLQVVTSLLMSTVLLVGLHYQLVWDRIISTTITGDRREIDHAFDATVHTQLAQLNQSGVVHYFVIGLFWFGVGLLACLVLWALANVIVELYNKIIYEKYYWNHPRIIKQLRVAFRRIGVMLVLVCVLIFTSVYGVPLWSSLFVPVFFSPLMAWDWVSLLLAISGGALNLYTLWITYHLLRMAL